MHRQVGYPQGYSARSHHREMPCGGPFAIEVTGAAPRARWLRWGQKRGSHPVCRCRMLHRWRLSRWPSCAAGSPARTTAAGRRAPVQSLTLLFADDPAWQYGVAFCAGASRHGAHSRPKRNVFLSGAHAEASIAAAIKAADGGVRRIAQFSAHHQRRLAPAMDEQECIAMDKSGVAIASIPLLWACKVWLGSRMRT